MGQIFASLTRHKDVFLLIVVATVLLMMILPLPTTLMDIMITMNICAAVLIILLALQIQNPVEFSTFPAILLVTTLFRLAISVSTTRLILLEGDAGRIVETFGEVVVSGNLVVGLVIFLIITVVQFLVITKGADRVAEVGARFTLDAMPGKQMSVDADVRAGTIDQLDAKGRRDGLERESKLFGAMDGAMKFVKGDAIAGLVITAINLIGGISIGMFQLGYTFGDALGLYALLTIGDGLVAQIPALLISVASGIIVTRVTGPQGSDLGTEITEQMSANHRTMVLAGVSIAAFGFVPGFPTAIFLVVGLGMSGFAWWGKRRADRRSTPAAFDWAGVIREHNETCDEIERRTRITTTATVCLPAAMLTRDPHEFRRLFIEIVQITEEQVGFPLGMWRFEVAEQSHFDRYEIYIGRDLVAKGAVDPDAVFVKANMSYLEALGVPCAGHFGAEEGALVAREHIPLLEKEGLNFLDLDLQILQETRFAIMKNLSLFLGFQSTKRLLAAEAMKNESLIEDLNEKLSVDQISGVLKLLTGERLPILSRTRILEAILDWAPRRPDPFAVLQQVRIAIGDAITRRFAPDGFLPAIIISPSLESMLRDGFRNANDQQFLVIDSEIARQIAAQARELAPNRFDQNLSPVLLTQQDIRRAVHNVLDRHGFYLPVLAYQEVEPDTVIYPVGFISAEQPAEMALSA